MVPTHATARELASAGVNGRIEVIGEGVAAAMDQPIRLQEIDRARAKFDLPGQYILAVGTLEPRKGFDILLDALALGLPARPLSAVVGQPGWGGTDVAAEAARRGIADRVRVLGRLSDDELAAVLAGATASVVPSRAEGFGLPLLEAMSRGVPIIHSDVPALVEVAGGTGICVPVGDVDSLRAAIERVRRQRATCGRDVRRRANPGQGLLVVQRGRTIVGALQGRHVRASGLTSS